MIINQNYTVNVNRQFEDVDVSVKVFKDAIKSDIDRLSKMHEHPKNIFDKSNIERLIGYLNSLLSKVDESDMIDIRWHVGKGGIIRPKNVSFEIHKEYGINTLKYIIVNTDTAIMSIDTSLIADMLAYELSYRDLGDKLVDIEKELENCRVTNIAEADSFRKLINNMQVEPYRMSRDIIISDCPYKDIEHNEIVKYFVNCTDSIKAGDRYHEVVSDICHKVNEYIVAEVMKCGEVKPVSIADTYIALKVNRDNIDSVTKVISDTSIRVFGRCFNIGAKIEIY